MIVCVKERAFQSWFAVQKMGGTEYKKITVNSKTSKNIKIVSYIFTALRGGKPKSYA